MKKLFAILLLAMIGFMANAQMATLNMPVNDTYLKVTTDYTITNTTASYLLISAPKHYKTTQDILVKLDSLSGNHTNVSVAVWGRKFNTSAWVAIGSAINWKGTTADTTIVFSNATANRYRDFKIVYTGTGTGTTKIDTQEFKLYLE